MQPDTSLVPLSAGEEIVDALQDLLQRATNTVVEEHGGQETLDTGGPVQAEITMRMLTMSEKARHLQRSAQGYVVAYIAREQLWRFHPEGYSNLRLFLRAAGLGSSVVSELTALGDVIVPYCDHQDIEINNALTPDRWPKLREAIPALRGAIRDNEPDKVCDILDDVRKAVSRTSVRNKYRMKRTKYGHSTTMRMADGRVLLVAVLDDEDAAELIVRRLCGALEWDLVLGSQIVNNTLRVVIDD
jgi:hypothetical protein